jgi:predicted ATPase/DNA-binding NarL/FixJ family response regulator/DNA-binding XRE family transcriptional regulator
MEQISAESFGALLRHYRELAGLSQEALAERAGLTRNAIGALERGQRRHPFPTTVHALATALQLSPEHHRQLTRLARTRGPAEHAPPPVGDAAQVPAHVAVAARRLQPRALPLAPNHLIGREAEYAELAQALADPARRLITLRGPGGVGKTRLALAVACERVSQAADAVAWVALAAITGPEQLAAAIADALGEALRGAAPPTEQLLTLLHGRTLLLVLDNMEHLLDAAPLLGRILAETAAVRLLVTSRERLRLGGEWVIDLVGLALTGDGQAEGAASQLFVARARQVTHTFAPSHADHAAIERICRLVDGLPLAIELAAAWIGTLAPAEIADEITRSLDVLARSERDSPARHASLRAVFDHSWQLLRPEEQRAFARLAVFPGSFTREAAAAVADATLAMLGRLIDASLLHRTDDSSGGSRYELHALLRQYARARLDDEPDAVNATYTRHCAYYARRLADLRDDLLSTAMHHAATEAAAELENVRLAWGWAVQQCDQRALAQMGQSLQVLCEVRGLFAESVALFEAAVRALRRVLEAEATTGQPLDPERTLTLGQLLSLSGIRLARVGRFAEAREQLLEGFALQEQREDLLVATGTLTWLGYLAYVLGAYDEAREWLTRSIALARAHGSSFFEGASQTFLALVAQAQGKADEARAVGQAGVDTRRRSGHPRGLAMGLWALSCIELAQGAIDAADAAAQEALQTATRVDDRWVRGQVLTQLAALALARDEPAAAEALAQESSAIAAALGDPWSHSRSLLVSGWLALAQGRATDARQQFEHARALADAAQLAPATRDAEYGLAIVLADDAPTQTLRLLASVVTDPATDDATRARAAQLHDALRAGAAPRSATLTAAAAFAGLAHEQALTPREVEVLQLLARGHSNRAIAAVLVVSVGTIKRHVNSILGKLQAHSRLEAVARARTLGLV